MGLFVICASAESKTATFYVGEKVYQTGTTDANGAMAIPGEPETGDGVFIGWVFESANGEKRLYAPSSAFRDDSTQTALTFRALSVNLRTLTGAAAGLSLPYSLRFDGALSGEDYRMLAALTGAENITVGLLTAPYENIIGKGENFNLVSGEVFITSNPATLTDTTGETLYFSARVENIAAKRMLDKFAARAYLTVRFADDQVRTVYAPFRNADHARSVHAVFAAAFEDATTAADGKYTAKFQPDGSDTAYYSPYTARERGFLENGLDRVVNVQLPIEEGEKVRVVSEYSINGTEFKEFRFYTSPYRVASVNYTEKIATVTITATGGASVMDILTYYLGGSYSSSHPDNILTDGNILTFTFRTDTTIE